MDWEKPELNRTEYAVGKKLNRKEYGQGKNRAKQDRVCSWGKKLN